jgi:hypothetical protein
MVAGTCQSPGHAEQPAIDIRGPGNFLHVVVDHVAKPLGLQKEYVGWIPALQQARESLDIPVSRPQEEIRRFVLKSVIRRTTFVLLTMFYPRIAA